MEYSSGDIKLFYALLQAGLWEKTRGDDSSLKHLDFSSIDWSNIYRLAQEQRVVGTVAAGLDYLTDVKPPEDVVMQFVGTALQLEQRNSAMNAFVAKLVKEMRNEGIYALLVKGQGVAQCYDRPLWRSYGDVDFFLDSADYERAKLYLAQFSSENKPERLYSKEKGYYLGPWLVELHGSLRTGLSTRVDKEIDDVQNTVFGAGRVRSWNNNGIEVLLPSPVDDVFLVFTHFIKHFYKDEGISSKQLCDWCRLLWTFRDSINVELLSYRLEKAGLITEWYAFAAFAVDYLGMPLDAMPLYLDENKWHKKASMIVAMIVRKKEPNIIKNIYANARVFPISTMRFFPGIVFQVNGLKIKERLKTFFN